MVTVSIVYMMNLRIIGSYLIQYWLLQAVGLSFKGSVGLHQFMDQLAQILSAAHHFPVSWPKV